MKTYAYICVFGLIAGMQSCQDDKIVFPTSPEAGTQDGEQGMPIAAPGNAILTGTYDHKFRIQWDGVSDRVAKAIIAYTENDGDRTVEVTDFSQDYFVQTEAFREYDFDLRYQGRDGSLSRSVKRTAKNKQYLVDHLRDNFEFVKFFNSLGIVWENEPLSPITVKVEYESAGQTHTLLAENSVKSQDTLWTVPLAKGDVPVKLVFTDEGGRSSEKEIFFDMQPTTYTTAEDKALWTITASNQNSNNHRPQNLINGITDADSHWHTTWGTNQNSPAHQIHPFELELTLDRLVAIDQITLHNRWNGNNDGVKTFDLYGKATPEDEYELIAQDLEQIQQRRNKRTFDIAFSKPIKMLKFVIKDSWANRTWAHLGEIDIRGFTE